MQNWLPASLRTMSTDDFYGKKKVMGSNWLESDCRDSVGAN